MSVEFREQLLGASSLLPPLCGFFQLHCLLGSLTRAIMASLYLVFCCYYFAWDTVGTTFVHSPLESIILDRVCWDFFFLSQTLSMSQVMCSFPEHFIYMSRSKRMFFHDSVLYHNIETPLLLLDTKPTSAFFGCPPKHLLHWTYSNQDLISRLVIMTFKIPLF